MFVCLLVCWFVCFLSATRHLSTLRRCLRVLRESRSRRRGGPARTRSGQLTARKRMHSERARQLTRDMPYNFSTKNRCADAFQKQRAHAVQLLNEKIAALMRAHAVVYVTAEIFKKREKENQHATSQVQFTVCLLLECLLFESY